MRPLKFVKRERRDFADFLIEVKIHSRLQGGKTELVAAQSPKQRFAFQRGDESFFSSDDSRLRTAEEFIAAEANKISAGFQHVARSWLMLRNAQ